MIGISTRIVRLLPFWVRLAPMDAMFGVLGLASSASILIGLGQTKSLSVMPPWGRVLWAVALTVGCLCWLVGLASAKQHEGHFTLTRVPILIFGLYLVSLASFVYGLGLFAVAGWGGVLPAASFWAIAAGTWLRRVDFSDRYRGDT